MNKESDLYPSNNIHEFVKSMSDLTFITNAPNQTLKDRFEQLIKDCQSFDCLVAYFYISGFHLIYKSLEKTEKIKILIGIGTSRETYNLMNVSGNQLLSHSETKQEVEKW